MKFHQLIIRSLVSLVLLLFYVGEVVSPYGRMNHRGMMPSIYGLEWEDWVNWVL